MRCVTCDSPRGVMSEDGQWTCWACGDEFTIGEPLADVRPRHGAWAVQLRLNDFTENLGHVEMNDCAGTLKFAKRVAEVIAERAGLEGPFTWDRDGTTRVMFGTIPEIDESEPDY